jgi:hypothetical protein
MDLMTGIRIYDLPEDSIVYCDSAYTYYYNEEVSREAAGITLRIAGKSNEIT